MERNIHHIDQMSVTLNNVFSIRFLHKKLNEIIAPKIVRVQCTISVLRILYYTYTINIIHVYLYDYIMYIILSVPQNNAKWRFPPSLYTEYEFRVGFSFASKSTILQFSIHHLRESTRRVFGAQLNCQGSRAPIVITRATWSVPRANSRFRAHAAVHEYILSYIHKPVYVYTIQ